MTACGGERGGGKKGEMKDGEEGEKQGRKGKTVTQRIHTGDQCTSFVASV